MGLGWWCKQMTIVTTTVVSGPIVIGTITAEKLQQPHVTDALLRKCIRELRDDFPQTQGTFACLKLFRAEKRRRTLAGR